MAGRPLPGDCRSRRAAAPTQGRRSSTRSGIRSSSSKRSRSSPARMHGPLCISKTRSRPRGTSSSGAGSGTGKSKGPASRRSTGFSTRPVRRCRSVRVRDCRRFGTADLAASLKTSADYTVIAAWAVTPESDLILLDLVRDHFEEPEILSQARAIFRRHALQYLTVEQNFIGLGVIQTLRRGRTDPETREHAPGLPVRALKAATDKLSRAQTAIVRCEAGQVYWPESGAVARRLRARTARLSGRAATTTRSMPCRWPRMTCSGPAAPPSRTTRRRPAKKPRRRPSSKRSGARQAERQADPDDEHWWGDSDP